MAILFRLNKEWQSWVDSRPDLIKKMCEKYPPNRLYLYKPTRQRVTIYSYSTDGTMTVVISGDFNAVIFERKMCVVVPEELEECDLPKKDELCGAVFEEEKDIKKVINSITRGCRR
jgi:hypothetical protein